MNENIMDAIDWLNEITTNQNGWRIFYSDSETKSCTEAALEAALALLKKQEAILLENQHKPYGNSLNANAPWISRCPKCGKKVEGKQTRYCKYCGQVVRWE